MKNNNNQTLLEISRAIATIRDKDELWQVMMNKLQPLLGFKASVSTVYSADYSQYRYFLFSGIFIENLESELKSHFNAYLPIKNTSDEWVMRQGDVCALTIEEKAELVHANPVAIEILKSIGVNYNLYIKLKSAGKVIGVQHFHFENREPVSEKTIALAKSITDLIATAVANILANEEILERELEKSRLLEISEAIATVQNHNQLLRVIYEKIKPVLSYDNAGLFVIDAAGETWREILDSEVLPDAVQTELTETANLGPWQLAGHHPQAWHYSETPVICSLEEQAEYYRDVGITSQFEVGIQHGLRQMIGAPLYCGGRKIGFLSFNSKHADFYSEKHLPLFRAITDLVAVAVANILANEEVLRLLDERNRRAEELAKSNEALARTAAHLAEQPDLVAFLSQVVIESCRQLGADAGYLITLDEKRRVFQTATLVECGAVVPMGALAEEMPFEEVAEFWFALSETMKPRYFDIEKEPENFWRGAVEYLRQRQHKSVVAYPLIAGKKMLGVMGLAFKRIEPTTEQQSELINALAQQAALAIQLTRLADEAKQTAVAREREKAAQQQVAEFTRINNALITANEENQRQLAEIETLKSKLEAENKYLTEEVAKNYNFEEIIGQSPQIYRIFDLIEQVAPTDATILIEGETGTGKELVARAVHKRSPRAPRPLIKINCATLPRELIESELFGHERGAFTGATERRTGKFELANGSTVFLDEVGELPLEMQVKLLRVLQEREIERVGGKGTIALDIRVVAATNRKLSEEVKAGRFRADLYYRLCTVELSIPPLRERQADIEPLTIYFAQKYAAKFSRQIESVSSAMRDELLAYDFPGNVRELEHIVEQAVILTRGEVLQLPRQLINPAFDASRQTAIDAPHNDGKNAFLSSAQGSEIKTIEEAQREHIVAALRQTNGKIKGKRGAAELLGINPGTLYFRMKKLGIER